MPTYYAVGSALVEEAEYADYELESLRRDQPIGRTFTTGVVGAEAALRTSTATGDVVPFIDIEFGKPLSVELRYVYPGKHPKPEWGDEKKDMLVTTAMRNIAAFNKAPRAINFLVKQVKAKKGFGSVAATDDGTPLVFYSPAVDVHNSVLTIDFGFRDFDPHVLKMLSTALKSAASVPIFATASFHLMFGSSLVNLGADIGKLVLEKPQVFRASEPIQFLRPGTTKSKAGFRLVTQTELARDELKAYEVHETGKLVDKNGAEYQGDTPYVVISLDGRPVSSYKDFTPTAASAAMLEDYFAIRESGAGEMAALKSALELYNDYRQRKKVDELDEDAERITDKNSEAYKENVRQRDAAAANIMNKELRPGART
jgi:hypothetical protein